MSSPTQSAARAKVAGPANCLIIVCIIAIAILMAAFIFSEFLLSSGVAREMKQPQTMSKETQVLIRMGYNIVLQIVSIIILIGSIRMRNLRSYSFAKTACILALIPCLGPCYVGGIPFGIWGLRVLADPEVRDAFES